MTDKNANLFDNNGICESCGDPKTKGTMQTAVPVLLGGDIGWGKMWVCAECLRKRKEEGKPV